MKNYLVFHFLSVKNLIIFQYLYEIISQSIEKLLKIFSPIHPTPKGSGLSWEFFRKSKSASNKTFFIFIRLIINIINFKLFCSRSYCSHFCHLFFKQPFLQSIGDYVSMTWLWCTKAL